MENEIKMFFFLLYIAEFDLDWKYIFLLENKQKKKE